jgi:hypothetical protein
MIVGGVFENPANFVIAAKKTAPPFPWQPGYLNSVDPWLSVPASRRVWLFLVLGKQISNKLNFLSSKIYICSINF